MTRAITPISDGVRIILPGNYSGIGEAPSDGKNYARRDRGWQEILSGNLPGSTAGDEGKALVVNAAGSAEWGSEIKEVQELFINGGQF